MSMLQFKPSPSTGVFSGFYLHCFRKITNILTKKQFREKKCWETIPHWLLVSLHLFQPEKPMIAFIPGSLFRDICYSFKHQTQCLTLEQRADLQSILHSRAFQSRKQMVHCPLSKSQDPFAQDCSSIRQFTPMQMSPGTLVQMLCIETIFIFDWWVQCLLPTLWHHGKQLISMQAE